MQITNENLELLGLNKTEFLIYTSLSEMGKAGAHLLSKRTAKKRTTVYSCLDSLINKGLVTVEKGKSSSIFSANRPESILNEIEKEKSILSKKELIANDFIKQISALFDTQSRNIPKIKYVEGIEGVNNFLTTNLPLWSDSISEYDNVWWGYQDHTFVEEYFDWLDRYWKNKSDSVRIQLLSNESKTEKVLKSKVKGRKIKTLKGKLDFTSTIWVCGDYIILIVARDNPHYAFQIYDKVFSANLRMLFQVFWEFKKFNE